MKAKHGAALVELQKVATKMGDDYQQQLTEALASARMADGKASAARTLRISSGKPVNVFEAAAWPAAFVEFFYGDCAPNLARPQRVGLRELFCYLATREELEYSLEGDKDDALIPGGCYRAPAQSRWNTPEIMAIFADVVRKVRILQTTKHMWERGQAPNATSGVVPLARRARAHRTVLHACLSRLPRIWPSGEGTCSGR